MVILDSGNASRVILLRANATGSGSQASVTRHSWKKNINKLRQVLYKFLQVLTGSDKFWHVLACFDKFWQILTGLTGFDRFWQVLAAFDRFWQVLTSFYIPEMEALAAASLACSARTCDWRIFFNRTRDISSLRSCVWRCRIRAVFSSNTSVGNSWKKQEKKLVKNQLFTVLIR